MWTLKCVLAQGPEKKKSSVHSFNHLKLNHVWLNSFFFFIYKDMKHFLGGIFRYMLTNSDSKNG